MTELRAYYELKAEFKGESPVGKQTQEEWFAAEIAYYEQHGGI